jgi:pimeloyl-ACP methyl ester carboxylesterase
MKTVIILAFFLICFTQELSGQQLIQSKSITDCKTKQIVDPSRTKLDSTRQMTLIVHGWNDWMNADWRSEMSNAICSSGSGYVMKVQWNSNSLDLTSLAKTAYNTLLSGWSGLLSGDIIYKTSADNTRKVGKELADYLNTLGLTGNTLVHCIGHSLGAHVCGFAGKNYALNGKKFFRISGLDPAGPLFSNDITQRLDRTDASVVDVYHTNNGWLGYSDAIGTVDYYPTDEWGKEAQQPGCGTNPGQLACNHFRAIEIYLSSISNSCYIQNKIGYFMNYATTGNWNFITAPTKPWCIDMKTLIKQK